MRYNCSVPYAAESESAYLTSLCRRVNHLEQVTKLDKEITMLSFSQIKFPARLSSALESTFLKWYRDWRGGMGSRILTSNKKLRKPVLIELVYIIQERPLPLQIKLQSATYNRGKPQSCGLKRRMPVPINQTVGHIFDHRQSLNKQKQLNIDLYTVMNTRIHWGKI